MVHCDQINVLGFFQLWEYHHTLQFTNLYYTFSMSKKDIPDTLSRPCCFIPKRLTSWSWLKASFQNFLQFPNLHLLVKGQCNVYSHHKMKWIVFKSFVLDLGQSHKSGSGFITSVTCSWSLSHIHTHEAPPAWCCRHNIDVNLCLIQNLSLVIFPPS